MDHTRACSKSSRAALAWTKNKRSLRKMRNLKPAELRILKNRGKKAEDKTRKGINRKTREIAFGHSQKIEAN